VCLGEVRGGGRFDREIVDVLLLLVCGVADDGNCFGGMVAWDDVRESS